MWGQASSGLRLLKNPKFPVGYIQTTVYLVISDAEYLIILEDDLSVSADFFVYFDWSLELFSLDETLYCISGLLNLSLILIIINYLA